MSEIICRICGKDDVDKLDVNEMDSTWYVCRYCDARWDELECQPPRLTPEGVWVSVAERLPEPESRVLAYAPSNKHSDTGPISVQNGSSCKYEITHWMPLPQPPKDGE